MVVCERNFGIEIKVRLRFAVSTASFQETELWQCVTTRKTNFFTEQYIRAIVRKL